MDRIVLDPNRAYVCTRTRYTRYTRCTGHKTIKAFQDIRQAISQFPLMHFIDNVSPIHLYTDASDYGEGGVLFQQVGDEMKPILFVSKSLNFVCNTKRSLCYLCMLYKT